MKDVSDAFIIMGLVIFTVCSCICDYRHDRRLKALERRCDEMCLRLGKCLIVEPPEQHTAYMIDMYDKCIKMKWNY